MTLPEPKKAAIRCDYSNLDATSRALPALKKPFCLLLRLKAAGKEEAKKAKEEVKIQYSELHKGTVVFAGKARAARAAAAAAAGDGMDEDEVAKLQDLARSLLRDKGIDEVWATRLEWSPSRIYNPDHPLLNANPAVCYMLVPCESEDQKADVRRTLAKAGFIYDEKSEQGSYAGAVARPRRRAAAGGGAGGGAGALPDAGVDPPPT